MLNIDNNDYIVTLFNLHSFKNYQMLWTSLVHWFYQRFTYIVVEQIYCHGYRQKHMYWQRLNMWQLNCQTLSHSLVFFSFHFKFWQLSGDSSLLLPKFLKPLDDLFVVISFSFGFFRRRFIFAARGFHFDSSFPSWQPTSLKRPLCICQ